jgi:UDP-glucuronate decarboxylase
MHPDDGRVVSRFIMQALHNKPVTIFGDGSQSRSFCYVDDLIKGLMAFMNGPDDFVGPLNLGNPGEYKILDLAEKIIRLTESKSTIEFRPLPEDDPKRRRPDIGLAKEKFDWQPQVELDAGLRKTINYFKELYTSS